MKKAYQLLLGQGLIRISLPMPPPDILEFNVTSVNKPYKLQHRSDFWSDQSYYWNGIGLPASTPLLPISNSIAP